MNSDKHEHPEKDETEANILPTPFSPDPIAPHDPYHALRFHNFRLLFLGTFTASVGEQMVNVAIGWELYNRTGSSLALGFVGLVQIIPTLLLSLPGGYLADRFDRKRIVLITLLVIMLSSVGLTVLSFYMVLSCIFTHVCSYSGSEWPSIILPVHPCFPRQFQRLHTIVLQRGVVVPGNLLLLWDQHLVVSLLLLVEVPPLFMPSMLEPSSFSQFLLHFYVYSLGKFLLLLPQPWSLRS